MADPSLGLTFQDYIIRVSEYMGTEYLGPLGNQAAQLPVDAHDLDLAKRLVNDGYRRFVKANPKWNFLNLPTSLTFAPTPTTGQVTTGGTNSFTDSALAGVFADNALVGFGVTVTHQDSSTDEYTVTANTGATGAITLAAVYGPGETIVIGDSYTMAAAPVVSGQPWRYYMPDDFYGLLLTPWTYNIGGPRLTINVVSEPEIRELRAGANTTGTVSACAFRPVPTTTASSGKRWEAIFWPQPAGQNTITATYKRFPQQLVNNTDRPISGFEHDDTILAAIIAEAERQRGDALGPREQAFQRALAESMKLDARSIEVKSRDFGDKSEDRVPFGRRPLSYYGVDTYNGVRIP